MNELTLKPCPFCGGPPKFRVNSDRGYWIECQKCGASTEMRVAIMDDPRKDLSDSWNRRVKG